MSYHSIIKMLKHSLHKMNPQTARRQLVETQKNRMLKSLALIASFNTLLSYLSYFTLLEPKLAASALLPTCIKGALGKVAEIEKKKKKKSNEQFHSKAEHPVQYCPFSVLLALHSHRSDRIGL